MVTMKGIYMDHDINLIRKITLLDSLSDIDIRANLSDGTFKIVSFKKNSVIHFDGDLCSKLEITLSGKVVVDRINESGDLLTISEFYCNDI